ncbi:ead/Ea22-like family protein [Enterobacter kobei]|uniref:ead/Ea22-like family protein n=1 Tax=Enterobacter kobei TaxID=208224 RepID=UPI00403F488F
MSNIDKRALREAAERAGQNDWEYAYTSDLSAPGRGYITVGGAEAIYCLNKAAGGVKQSENVLRYIAAASPETMLALLDELEAKDKSIDFLKEQLAQLANFNPDWDKLEAATDSLREHIAKLSSAEKRIAELERKEQHSERQSVIDALAGSGEEWSDIEEYMQKWDAERASAAGKGE